MVNLNFDARTVEPSAGIEPIPAGWYNAMIDETEMKPTRSGDGHYLNVRYTVLDGQYANRKVFQMLNLNNPSVAAKEIAYKQLSAICHAIGLMVVNDSTELHGKPLKIRVRIQKDPAGQYDDQNQVTSYKNINEPVPGATPAGFAPQAPTPPAPPTAPVAPPQGWAPAAPPTVAPPQNPAPPMAVQPPVQPQPTVPWTPQPPASAPVPQPVQPGWTPPANPQPWATQAPQNPVPPPQPQPPQNPIPPWAKQQP